MDEAENNQRKQKNRKYSLSVENREEKKAKSDSRIRMPEADYL